jgi:hypothetical protein
VQFSFHHHLFWESEELNGAKFEEEKMPGIFDF